MRALLPVNLPTPTPDPNPIPDPPTPTPDPPVPDPTPTPPEDIIATVISIAGLNMRETPVNGTIKARIGYRKRVKILAARPQGGTSNYMWAQVQAVEGVGWMRTDYLSIPGDASRYGLSKGDEYPAPMQNYWWVRGHNQNQNPGEANHNGWDFGATTGEAVRCASSGGLVVRLMTCTRCTASKPNVLSQGIPLNSPSVLQDPAWGFGYGNAVIVRYLNNLLPASARTRLAARGMPGAHLFVIYAHLSRVDVQVGQPLMPLTQVGVIGNTGNSTATHLHIEVRASYNDADTNWGAMRNFDPEITFLR
jgi:murein DD-endopeptidase MepM/ murein hydrolase activator NlpD